MDLPKSFQSWHKTGDNTDEGIGDGAVVLQ